MLAADRPHCGHWKVPAVLQAGAKWRVMWRLAPSLMEHWSASGRLNAINAAVTTTTKKVLGPPT